MRSVHQPPVSHVTIWAWLVMLLAVGVVLPAAPLPKTIAVILIVTVATLKATLVLRHYMHLRGQPVMVYVVLGVPLALVLALMIVLIPDIAFR